MKKTISRIRHYYIKPKIAEFIVENGIRSLPVDPFELIRRNKWPLRTYQYHSEKLGISVRDIIDTYETEDAFTIYQDGRYSINYNDEITSPGRIRFTLMHEIGHIYLNHLSEFEQTVLTRSGLSDAEYELLEKEANIFAAEVLSPFPVLQKLGWDKHTTIQKYCGLSKRAAISRVAQLLGATNNNGQQNKTILNNFYKYIYQKKCTHCGLGLVAENEKYCPVCGNSLEWGDDIKMKYKGFSLSETGKALLCPKCNNEEIHNEGDYCKICGTYVTNKCAGETDLDPHGNEYVVQAPCDTVAEGNARFCVYCGCRTTFYQNGLLSCWEEEKKGMELGPGRVGGGSGAGTGARVGASNTSDRVLVAKK